MFFVMAETSSAAGGADLEVTAVLFMLGSS